MKKREFYAKKKKNPKRIGLREIRMSDNYYLNRQFVCHLCGELHPIKRMIMYPGNVKELVLEFPRPYDGACSYCFHYELSLETQKKILEGIIKQREIGYKGDCLMKRHSGKMGSDMFSHQWVNYKKNEFRNGTMLYFRYLKQELRDVIRTMEILSYDTKKIKKNGKKI